MTNKSLKQFSESFFIHTVFYRIYDRSNRNINPLVPMLSLVQLYTLNKKENAYRNARVCKLRTTEAAVRGSASVHPLSFFFFYNSIKPKEHGERGIGPKLRDGPRRLDCTAHRGQITGERETLQTPHKLTGSTIQKNICRRTHLE